MDDEELMQRMMCQYANRMALFFMNDPSKENFMKFMSDAYDSMRGTIEEMQKKYFEVQRELYGLEEEAGKRFKEE